MNLLGLTKTTHLSVEEVPQRWPLPSSPPQNSLSSSDSITLNKDPISPSAANGSPRSWGHSLRFALVSVLLATRGHVIHAENHAHLPSYCPPDYLSHPDHPYLCSQTKIAKKVQDSLAKNADIDPVIKPALRKIDAAQKPLLIRKSRTELPNLNVHLENVAQPWETCYELKTHSIQWNPLLGAGKTGGFEVFPDRGLKHEIGHASFSIHFPITRSVLGALYHPRFRHYEERRVIQEFDNLADKAIHGSFIDAPYDLLVIYNKAATQKTSTIDRGSLIYSPHENHWFKCFRDDYNKRVEQERKHGTSIIAGSRMEKTIRTSLKESIVREGLAAFNDQLGLSKKHLGHLEKALKENLEICEVYARKNVVDEVRLQNYERTVDRLFKILLQKEELLNHSGNQHDDEL